MPLMYANCRQDKTHNPVEKAWSRSNKKGLQNKEIMTAMMTDTPKPPMVREEAPLSMGVGLGLLTAAAVPFRALATFW